MVLRVNSQVPWDRLQEGLWHESVSPMDLGGPHQKDLYSHIEEPIKTNRGWMTRTRLSQFGTPGFPGPNVQVTFHLCWNICQMRWHELGTFEFLQSKPFLKKGAPFRKNVRGPYPEKHRSRKWLAQWFSHWWLSTAMFVGGKVDAILINLATKSSTNKCSKRHIHIHL